METSILIIDNDPLVHDTLNRVFESKGYQVFHAETGSDGIAAAKLHQPNIILLDMSIPESADKPLYGNKIDVGLNTVKTLKELEETRPIPVIAITAHNWGNAKTKYIEAGCAALVPKPLWFPTLCGEIEKQLQSPQA